MYVYQYEVRSNIMENEIDSLRSCVTQTTEARVRQPVTKLAPVPVSRLHTGTGSLGGFLLAFTVVRKECSSTELVDLVQKDS
jgi:hypothetical protein